MTAENGRSGRRTGGGRKAGKATTRTREIADKLANDGGEMPLEYMLRVMRQRDDDIQADVRNGVIDEEEAQKLIKERDARRDDMAGKAAPYCHPRLAAIEADLSLSKQEEWLGLIMDDEQD